MPSLAINHLEWVHQKLFETAPWLEKLDCPTMTPKEIIWTWLIWLYKNSFIASFAHTQPPLEPLACVIYRPIESDKIERYTTHWADTLFEYDFPGDTLHVDFGYGPGHMRALVGFLKSSPYKNVSWQDHITGKIWLIPMSRLRVIPTR